MVVGVCDAPVMLFLIFVFLGIRSGVAPQPELLDELLPLIIGVEPLKSLALFVGDDVSDIFFQPFLPRCFQLFF